MAGQIRRKAINIVEDLKEYSEEYDYFQAVRLLERLKLQKASQRAGQQTLQNSPPSADRAAPGSRRQRRTEAIETGRQTAEDVIRIRPDLSLDYADKDIVEAEVLDDGSVSLSTSFMGLYGISSPLPAYYTEELFDDEWDGNTAPRDFLDIIHQHLYPLLFKAWQKYRFAYQTLERGESKYWDLLFSLIGLADKEIRKSSRYSLQFLPYLGLFSQRQRSILGLRTILRDVLNNKNLEIKNCVGREVSIPPSQRCQLGRNQCILGQDISVGQSVYDKMGKFTIVLDDLSEAQFQRFLKDEQYVDFLRTVVQIYVNRPLEVSIKVSLSEADVKPIELGAQYWSALGQDTWLRGTDNAACGRTVELPLL